MVSWNSGPELACVHYSTGGRECKVMKVATKLPKSGFRRPEGIRPLAVGLGLALVGE